MAGPRNAIIDAIVEGYAATKIVNYVGVSCHALVDSLKLMTIPKFVDFLHTFPSEVRLMWPAPLGLPKILFFALRYYILAHSFIAMYYGLFTNLNPDQCYQALLRVIVSAVAVTVVSETILFIRVFAFSGRNKIVLAYLIIHFMVLNGTSFYLLVRFVRSIKFIPLPIKNITCLPIQTSSDLLAGTFGVTLASVTIVMLIMMYIAFRKHRNFNSGLLTVFYRDGIFYFVTLSVMASANIGVLLADISHGMKFLLVEPEVYLHVILSTRMLLHLREWAEREHLMSAMGASKIESSMDFSSGSGTDTTMTVMEFSTRLRRPAVSGELESTLRDQ